METPREHRLGEDLHALGRGGREAIRRPWTFLVVGLAAGAAAGCWVLGREPVFRGEASLVLEDPRERSPLLGSYDIPVGVTDVEEAAAILGSTELAARLVAAPEDGRVATPDHPEWPLRLGLTTRVVDESQVVLADRVRRTLGRTGPGFRVHGAVDSAAPGAPARIRLRFLDAHRVVVSLDGPLPGIEWPGDDPQVLAWEPGLVLPYRGLRFRLEVRGEVDDRTFLLTHTDAETAARVVRDSVRVETRPGEKGVLHVVVDERDPELAAAIANGLVAHYVERDGERVRARAAADLAYVRDELGFRRRELESLDDEIAEWRAAHPDLVDPRVTATNLVEERAGLRSELTRVARFEANLDRVLAALAAGDRGQVSRLGPDLDDPLARRILEQIQVFEDEARRVGRAETGEFQTARKILLEQRRDGLEQLERRAWHLDAILEGLAKDDLSVLGLLGDEHARDGAVAVDDFTVQYLTLLGEMQVEFLKLEAEYQPTAEPVVVLRENVARVVDRIERHLTSQRVALGAELQMTRDSVLRWEELVHSQPNEERASIEASLEDLWTRAEAALTSRLEAVRDQRGELRLALDELAGRLRALPDAEKGLTARARRRDVLDAEVRGLLVDRERGELALAGVAAAARPLDTAFPPHAPTRPTAPFAAVVALLFGATAGVVASLLRARRAGARPEAGGLEAATGLGVCAVLPAAPRETAGAPWSALLDDPDGDLAESLRTLRTRVRAARPAKGDLRTLGVTAAESGEGASATAVGLALAFALEGRRVLLVDAVLRAPTLHDAFEVELSPGLGESLEGHDHWSSGVVSARYPNLHLLPAGAPERAPGDLLAGAALHRVLEEAACEYDLVLLDLPAVLEVPDVEALGAGLDGVVLVQGPRAHVERVARAAELLRRAGVPVLGLARRARGRRALRDAA